MQGISFKNFENQTIYPEIRKSRSNIQKQDLQDRRNPNAKEHNEMLNILYEDEAILVVWKPVGMESQSARGFQADMVSEIRRYLSTKNREDNHNLSTKSTEPYVGVIHRLDKPVSGVMVYAKEKKAAAALSKQVSEGKMHKKYLTVLCGKPVDNVEKYVDYLLKDEKENVSRIVDMGIKGGKRAELICRALETKEIPPYGQLTLAEIELLTGRHHQIRVQMSGHGMPIWGDNRYNPEFSQRQPAEPGTRIPRRALRTDVALAAFELTFTHPVTGKQLTFRQNPSGGIFRQFGAFPS